MGDPHIKLWNGSFYDFHGECDLVLVSSPVFGGSAGLDIHIRTTIVDTWSYISSVSAKIGHDVLEVTKRGNFVANYKAHAPLPKTLGGHPVTYTKAQNVKHAKFHVFDIDLDQGQGISIRSFRAQKILAVKVDGFSPEDFGDSVGLMGSFPHGDMVARNGTMSMTVEQANAFGKEWQVRTGDTNLFRVHRAPQWPDQCIMPVPLSTTSTVHRGLDDTEGALLSLEQRANVACAEWGEDFENCVADVVATGDLEVAKAGSY